MAYDSIDRRKLIEILIEYGINPKIIDMIVQMYKNDFTVINLGKMNEKVEVTGGIRQGCCISTLLFKMVTYKIIEELRKQKKYKIGKYEDNSIWLADDATLIAEDLDTMKELLDCLSRVGKIYGVQINEEKTKIMQIKGRYSPSSFQGYDIVTEAKYLGVTVGGRGRDIFEKENKLSIEKAEKKVNTLMAEVRKSADKVAVGKAIWKMMSIPAILFGRAVVPTCSTRIEKLQRLENRVWRYLLDIGGYSTVDALRGEIGASLVKTRVMETVLQYIRSTMNSEFGNIKRMMEDTIKTKKGKWFKNANSYRLELGISWDSLFNMSEIELKRRIREYDTKIWEQNLNKKRVLTHYVKGKTNIGYEHCYRNTRDSIYYARARINSLKLEEAKGRGNKHHNKECKLCGKEDEDLVHFLIKCPALEGKRNYELINKKIQDPEQRLIDVLYKQENHRGVGIMIREMWLRRKDIQTCKERMYKISKNKKKKGDYLSRTDPGPVGIGQNLTRKRTVRSFTPKG